MKKNKTEYETYYQDLTLEEFIDFQFNRNEEDKYWNSNEIWQDSEEKKLLILISLFENLSLLNKFSDQQIANSLWIIMNDYHPNHPNLKVSDDLKIKSLNATLKLYQSFFSKKCSKHYSHFNEKGSNPINTSCYMWWDIPFYTPSFFSPLLISKNKIKDIILDHYSEILFETFEKILRIDSICCQESALHGLGHICPHVPKKVISIIDKYLEENKNIQKELKEYALSARKGNVQ